MKPYEILESPINEYLYIVCSNSCESITENLPYLKQVLINKNIKGKLLFDNIMSTGSFSRRYGSIEFDGKQFRFNTYKILSSVNKSIINVSKNYYKSNINYVNQNKILSRSKKFLLLNL